MVDHQSEQALREQLANAPEAPRESGSDAPRSAGERPGNGGRPRKSRAWGEIFDDSPVLPLGVDGDAHMFLDVKGQLRKVPPTFQRNHMKSIFGGNVGLLSRHFPVFTYPKDGPAKQKPGEFDGDKLMNAMMQAVYERGVWSPVGRVRGAGAWADEEGQLIYHAGDEVLIGDEWRPPGVYEGKVYPASDPIPRPASEGARADAGLAILELIEGWNWARPDVDPMLALGAICAQMIGGALDWRPVTWLTGDQATGKSTFQRLLRFVHGGSDGLLQASDATEAGIRSVIGYSSLPVALDELEPDDDPKKGKAAAIIRLARIAASGDQILRGSTDQKGYQGNAYSCFLFSSILVPPLPPQDRSRLILLDLNRIAADAPKPKDDPRRLRALGAALRRRLIDGWHDWPERLDLWRGALAAHGHGGRDADNYGTVLALADMGLHDTLPARDVLDAWCAKLVPWLDEAAGDVGSNAEDMLTHLISQPLDPFRRGRQYLVSHWVACAARLDLAGDNIDGVAAGDVNRTIAPYGMRVKGQGSDACLIIANKTMAGLCKLFDGTPWASGVWSQAARRVTGAESIKTSFARVSSRAFAIPFTSIPGILNAMDDTGAGDMSQRNPGPPVDDISQF